MESQECCAIARVDWSVGRGGFKVQYGYGEGYIVPIVIAVTISLFPPQLVSGSNWQTSVKCT